MNKTVDDIEYLCCVADTKQFYGIDSIEFKDWKEIANRKYDSSYNKDSPSREDWFIEKYIPVFDKYVKSDIDMLTLPKVFRAKKHVIQRIQSFTQQMSMDISINWDKNLVLVL